MKGTETTFLLTVHKTTQIYQLSVLAHCLAVHPSVLLFAVLSAATGSCFLLKRAMKRDKQLERSW